MVARLNKLLSGWLACASKVAIFYQKLSYLREAKLTGTRGSSSSFVEEHIGLIKTTQDALIVWHFSSTAEAAARNEVVSTIPQIEFRFLIACRLSTLQQKIINHNRNGLLVGILSDLVW